MQLKFKSIHQKIVMLNDKTSNLKDNTLQEVAATLKNRCYQDQQKVPMKKYGVWETLPNWTTTNHQPTTYANTDQLTR